MRRPLSLLAAAAAVGSSALAVAGPVPEWAGGTIDLELRLPDGDGGFEPKNEVEVEEYFNRANCLCDEAEFAVRFTLVDPPASVDPDAVEIWFGTSCDTDMVSERLTNCTMQHEFTDAEALRSPQQVPFRVSEIAGSCDPNERERNVYALVDPGDDGIDTAAGDYSAEPLPIAVDTRPPPAPRDIEASGGEDAVQVSWTLPDDNSEDIKYFQVLCARADGSTSDDDGFPRTSPRYLTTAEACGVADDSVCPQPVSVSRLGDIDAGAGDAAPPADAGAVECGDLPGELEALSSMHVCGEADGTESSIRVDGLENGVPYRIVLVVVDPSRNPLALDLGEHVPSQAKDFWEHYHDRGGTAEGGCDLVGGSSGLAAALVLLVAVVLFAPGRRRRRIGGGLALFLVAAAGRAVSAEPWWESVDEPVQDEVGAAPVHWDLEIKFGPYVPAVDSEFDLGEDEVGPFEQMFGDGPFLMSGLTLDRYFLHPAGQLGLTGSLGFLTKSARAFQVDGEGNVVTNEDGVPIRSEGDSNKFRLIPMSLGVVYRYTQLDDRFHALVVPYGRIGLSYYLWWVTAPSGDIAQVPTDDCPDLDGCSGDRARGGSLGWQASAGLALRLERIDPDTEVALRTELGIEHAGFMVEVTYAAVDGFGSDRKLAVGDATWFGGINFEF